MMFPNPSGKPEDEVEMNLRGMKYLMDTFNIERQDTLLFIFLQERILNIIYPLDSNVMNVGIKRTMEQLKNNMSLNISYPRFKEGIDYLCKLGWITKLEIGAKATGEKVYFFRAKNWENCLSQKEQIL